MAQASTASTALADQSPRGDATSRSRTTPCSPTRRATSSSLLPKMDGSGQQDVQLALQNVDRVIVDELELCGGRSLRAHSGVAAALRRGRPRSRPAERAAAACRSPAWQATPQVVTGVAGRPDVLNRRVPRGGLPHRTGGRDWTDDRPDPCGDVQDLIGKPYAHGARGPDAVRLLGRVHRGLPARRPRAARLPRRASDPRADARARAQEPRARSRRMDRAARAVVLRVRPRATGTSVCSGAAMCCTARAGTARVSSGSSTSRLRTRAWHSRGGAVITVSHHRESAAAERARRSSRSPGRSVLSDWLMQRWPDGVKGTLSVVIDGEPIPLEKCARRVLAEARIMLLLIRRACRHRDVLLNKMIVTALISMAISAIVSRDLPPEEAERARRSARHRRRSTRSADRRTRRASASRSPSAMANSFRCPTSAAQPYTEFVAIMTST